MVDPKDIVKLEEQLKRNQQLSPLDDAVTWARKMGIPAHVRYSTIHKLYAKYGHMSNTDLVQKMVRSKTGLDDPERNYHELIIQRYPNLMYEVPSPLGSSVDFVGDVPSFGTAYIEVKSYASWKQAATLILYRNEYPEYEPLVVYFGKHNKVNLIVKAMNDIGIFVAEVDEYGEIRLLKNRIERDYEF